MSRSSNARTLDTIADNIYRLQRWNIIEVGDLLIEAKAQCEHGNWLNWLFHEFDFSVDTAERYMAVAELAAKFRKLRNLKISKSTLYELADHVEKEVLPALINELAKHATETRLAARDAKRVINIGIARHRFGDHPDATLVALADLDKYRDECWLEKAVAALKAREPTTDESARLIVDEIQLTAGDEIKDEAEQEYEAILDGAPPDLPPPTTPPEPQKLRADTDWAETKSFVYAVNELRELRAKPVARFVGMFSPAELREVGDFLMAVAEHADRAKAEAA